MAVAITGCHAQEGGMKKDFSSSQDTTTQSKPQASWKVNKRYDDNGNLIGYDSTYSWSYSSEGAVSNNAEADSMMNVWSRQFDEDMPSFFNHRFGAATWNDSLFSHGFTGPGELMQKWENNFFDMGKMMRQLDSLGNSFFDSDFPSLETKPKS